MKYQVKLKGFEKMINRRKWYVILSAALLLAAIAIVVRINRPLYSSKSCQEYYAGMANPPAAATA
jgi:hypothetical protein